MSASRLVHPQSGSEIELPAPCDRRLPPEPDTRQRTLVAQTRPPDSLAVRPAGKVGLTNMLAGGTHASNIDPYAVELTSTPRGSHNLASP
jgi:hypothetical protein